MIRDNIKVEGDFFVVTGTATNRINCTLPHLRLPMMMHYKDPDHPPMRQDIFHITDRALEPGESRRFKIEGEYSDGMDYVEIDVWGVESEGRAAAMRMTFTRDLPNLTPLNDWRETPRNGATLFWSPTKTWTTSPR
ncbi:hypothetical protein KAU45_09405 [bacterium]|nr:hypothetical protein [bacterium]